MEDQDIFNVTCTPPELKDLANDAMNRLLPEKSASLYEKQYKNFINWANEHHASNYTENVFLAYFRQKSEVNKSSTLWSIYSMLKSTFISKHNVNISKFSRLISFIKQQNAGYKPKKSNIFTRENLIKFVKKAPDSKYLMWKVCMIFGISGACRMDELKKMTLEDVEDKDNFLIVKIPDSKTGKPRIFTVPNGDLTPLDLYRKYVSLRPPHTPHKLLFVFYNSGKCSIQPVGIHTFGKIPKSIAVYLNLPDPNNFTGHAFRRTSASLLADTGSEILTLKQHGGWKSSSVAEGYVENSLCKKREIGNKIVNGASEHMPSTSVGSDFSVMPSTSVSSDFSLSSNSEVQPINISNNVNCQITINFNK